MELREPLIQGAEGAVQPEAEAVTVGLADQVL
jgi:hypothetical protein